MDVKHHVYLLTPSIQARSCVRVDVAVLGSPSLIVLYGRKATLNWWRHSVQELCESRGGHPGLSVPYCRYILYGRKATLNWWRHSAQELCESRSGLPGRSLIYLYIFVSSIRLFQLEGYCCCCCCLKYKKTMTKIKCFICWFSSGRSLVRTISVGVPQQWTNNTTELRSCVKVEVDALTIRLPIPNSPYVLCGRKVRCEEEECLAAGTLICQADIKKKNAWQLAL